VKENLKAFFWLLKWGFFWILVLLICGVPFFLKGGENGRVV
jgi:hypothetical protein